MPRELLEDPRAVDAHARFALSEVHQPFPADHVLIPPCPTHEAEICSNEDDEKNKASVAPMTSGCQETPSSLRLRVDIFCGFHSASRGGSNVFWIAKKYTP